MRDRFGMGVLLDEFGLHRDSRAIWTALFPSITRGFRITIASTPMGKKNKFYDLFTDWSKKQAAGDPKYSVRTVTITDAVAGGLELKDDEGKPLQPGIPARGAGRRRGLAAGIPLRVPGRGDRLAVV